MAVGDTYKLVAGWRNTVGSHTCANVFYFRQEGALVLDTPGEDLFDSFAAKMVTPYIALVTGQLVLDTITISQAPAFLTEYQLTSYGQTGQLTGEALPPRTAGLIAYRSDNLTRRGRGRIFLPPANEAASSGGSVTVSYQALMNSFISAWESMADGGLEYAGWQPMQWSDSDQIARPIVLFQPRVRWSSQRDRGSLY